MLSILVRTVLVYFFLIVSLRIMGKRQLGELEVTDLVTALLISELSTLPISDPDIPLSHALIPMTTLLFLEILFSVTVLFFPRIKNLLSPKPTFIIKDGKLNRSALVSLRITVEELLGEMRQQGYPFPDEIRDAILEKNGKLTVIPKQEFSPPTLGQLHIPVSEEPLMHVVLSGGVPDPGGLKLIGKDTAWLIGELENRGYSKKDIFCALADKNGKLYLIPGASEQKPLHPGRS